METGIGAVPVRAQRMRDRGGELKFSSSILPPYLGRTPNLEELRRGVCERAFDGDFSTAAGKKEVVGIADGYHESAESWEEMLLSLKQRGLMD